MANCSVLVVGLGVGAVPAWIMCMGTVGVMQRLSTTHAHRCACNAQVGVAHAAAAAMAEMMTHASGP